MSKRQCIHMKRHFVWIMSRRRAASIDGSAPANQTTLKRCAIQREPVQSVPWWASMCLLCALLGYYWARFHQSMLLTFVTCTLSFNSALTRSKGRPSNESSHIQKAKLIFFCFQFFQMDLPQTAEPKSATLPGITTQFSSFWTDCCLKKLFWGGESKLLRCVRG